MSNTINNRTSVKVKFKYLLIFGLTIIFFVGGAILAHKWCSFRNILSINKIEISGCYVLTRQNVLNQIREELDNNTLNKIDCKKIQKKLKDLDYVRASNVAKRFPNTLKIRIIERVPLCYLITESGNFMLDKTGVILPFPDNSLNSNLPIITGYKIEDKIEYGKKVNSSEVMKTVRLFTELKHELPSIFNQISEISHLEQLEEYYLYLNSNTKIYLGSDKIKAKINTLVHFMRQLPEDVEITKYKYLDLRWKDQIVSRSKNT